MSKIALTPNASGTGVFTIASPNSNTDRTLTLPDEAGTLDRLERAGNVLQVLGFSQTLSFTTSSTSYTDTGITGVTITPSSTSSKILLLARMPTYTSRYGYGIQVKRNGTAIYTPGISPPYEMYCDPSTNANLRVNWVMNIVDSPATTSACTYTFFMAVNAGSSGVGEGYYTSFFTLMEIAA